MWTPCLRVVRRKCNTPRACHANRACATIQSVLFSYPEVLYRSFGSSITFVLDETHWHRINAKVASHVFSLLASVEGTTVCLEIPLQSPLPPPPPGHRHLVTVSPPHPGDRRALPRDFARGGRVQVFSFVLPNGNNCCCYPPHPPLSSRP